MPLQCVSASGVASPTPASSQVLVATTALDDTSEPTISSNGILFNSNSAPSPTNGISESSEMPGELPDLFQEEMWVDMVANAGFDLHDGIFYHVQ